MRVPGTRWRIGLDPLLGLVPGLGDATTAVFAVALLGTSVRYGVPALIIVRMGLNIGFDLLMGLIPVVGDLSDAIFKSNARNLRLLQRHARGPREPTLGDYAVVGGVAAALAGLMGGVAWLTFAGLRALLGLLG